jgi:hypothetical protein
MGLRYGIYCREGGVDIGTGAKVPLNLVVYLKKKGKLHKNL